MVLAVLLLFSLDLIKWFIDEHWYNTYGRPIESCCFGIAFVTMSLGTVMINRIALKYKTIFTDDEGRKRFLFSFGIITATCTGQFLTLMFYDST